MSAHRTTLLDSIRQRHGDCLCESCETAAGRVGLLVILCWLVPALLTLFLSGCRQPDCVTPCGLAADGADCETLALYEAAALDAYEFHAHLDAGDSCRALDGWRVEVQPPHDNHGEYARGTTDRWQRLVTVDALPPGNLLTLAHEFGHVVEGCSNPTHEGWGSTKANEETRFYAAILEVSDVARNHYMRRRMLYADGGTRWVGGQVTGASTP